MIPLGQAFLSLNEDIQTRILVFLSPDDLGILSRCVEELAGIEEDKYLRKVWFRETAPSRLSHALFSPSRARPDPEELVRRGTLKGVAIVNGVRSHGYWCSESAVRISRIHHNLHLNSLRRLLTQHIESIHQHPHSLLLPPSPQSTRHRHSIILRPSSSSSSSRTTQSAIITQKVYQLNQKLKVDSAKRALRGSRVGERSVEEVLQILGSRGVLIEDFNGRVRWAICPSIKGRIRDYENLGERT